jgi:hypothetical protein
MRTPAEIVAWLGAVQAQEFGPAKWALGLRAARLTNAGIDEAFDDGRIVRTHILRPTWHFVAPEDLRWMQRLTGPRVQRLSASYHRNVGLAARDFARSRRVIERALGEHRFLTRAALGAALKGARIACDGLRLAFLMMQAELDLVVCSGPRQGKQFTYALVDDRVPVGDLPRGDEALAELARRYFRSHGPATVHDFVWWSGLTVGQARTGLAALGRGVESQAINGTTYWSIPSGKRGKAAGTPPIVHLLPIYDEYLNALRDRSLARDPAGPTVTTTDFTGLPNQLVIDGILRGAWKVVSTGDAARIDVRPFRALSRNERDALKRAAARYGRFAGVPTTITVV